MKALAILVSLVAMSGDPQPLYTEVSSPGESLDQFAHRIAPRARDTTAELGSEICGNFQTDGQAHRIEFKTNRSEWGCNIDFITDENWKATRLTMHTHTPAGGQGFSAQDDKHRLQGYVVSPRAISKRVGNIERTSSL